MPHPSADSARKYSRKYSIAEQELGAATSGLSIGGAAVARVLCVHANFGGN